MGELFGCHLGNIFAHLHSLTDFPSPSLCWAIAAIGGQRQKEKLRPRPVLCRVGIGFSPNLTTSRAPNHKRREQNGQPEGTPIGVSLRQCVSLHYSSAVSGGQTVPLREAKCRHLDFLAAAGVSAVIHGCTPGKQGEEEEKDTSGQNGAEPINHVLCQYYLVTAARFRSAVQPHFRPPLPHRTRCTSAVASRLVFQLGSRRSVGQRRGSGAKHAIRYTGKVRKQIPSVSIRYRC